ncbi:ABC transporter permease [Nocardioides mesophilus]|uniref:ABC transporter permease n=1 Tax=Nocardioides mesophilus TaxID=433659 RepID=A0A7G9R7F3_9ACTN|nr:ABC transporter permease [Nocardioides mesophilus]QNN51528.1 ABC transporter permease [Nocardioides mesophilus]
MTLALVRSELHKIFSTRLWWGLLLGAVVYTGLSAVAAAATAGMEPGAGQAASPPLGTAAAYRGVYASSMFGGAYIFAMILGITGMTGEYRYQTITPTFLVTPRRSRVVAAKMVANLLVGLGYAAAALLSALAFGALTITIRGEALGLGADRLWSSVALAALAIALWTLLGIGIGTLIRNQVAAILIAVFVTFLVEPLATYFLSAADLDAVVKWLPTNASAALTSPASTILDYLDWWVGGIVLLGYAALLAGLGMLLSVRRDIT